MREYVTDHSGNAPPAALGFLLRNQRRGVKRGLLIEIVLPLAGRNLRHAAEQPLDRPRAHQNGSVLPDSNECGAAAQLAGLFRSFSRIGFLLTPRSRDTR